MILRRPIVRPAFAVFLAIFFAVAAYTFTRPKLYEATATLVARGYYPVFDEGEVETPIRSSVVGVDTVKNVVESDYILDRVADSLSSELRLKPDEALFRRRLQAGLLVSAKRSGNTLLTFVGYRHRQPERAAALANAFAGSASAHLIARRIENEASALRTLEEFHARAQKEVDAAADALARAGLDAAVRAALESAFREKRSIARQIGLRLEEARTAVRPGDDWLQLTLAKLPAASDHIYPKHLFHLTIGCVGGLFAALLVARRRGATRASGAP